MGASNKMKSTNELLIKTELPAAETQLHASIQMHTYYYAVAQLLCYTVTQFSLIYHHIVQKIGLPAGLVCLEKSTYIYIYALIITGIMCTFAHSIALKIRKK